MIKFKNKIITVCFGRKYFGTNIDVHFSHFSLFYFLDDNMVKIKNKVCIGRNIFEQILMCTSHFFFHFCIFLIFTSISRRKHL
jgi:hypothetical protein